MRRSRSLNRNEQCELLALLGLLVVGLVGLAAAWRLAPLTSLSAFAAEQGATPAQQMLPLTPADSGVAPSDSDSNAVADNQDIPDDSNAQQPAGLPPVLPQINARPQPRETPPARIAPKPRPEIKNYNGKRYQYVRTIRMRVTAYAADPRCCYPFPGTTTASGLPVETNGGRLVAADTRIVPLHWLVAIPGYHAGRGVPVLDRGGAIKGHRLDVLLPSYEQAKEWGSRYINVKIYKPLD